MKVSVIGTGYVGLVTAICMASLGHHVIGADIDKDKIALLMSGGLPHFEPGLYEILSQQLETGNIRFTTDLDASIEAADVLFICVGTPSLPSGDADLTALWEVVDRTASLGRFRDSMQVVVVKSTVPVGTSDLIASHLASRGANRLQVVSNPEFLRQGSAVHDFLHPDRIVIGALDEQARAWMINLYAGLCAPYILCDRTCAELIKYASNSFLAMKISFANMMANLCTAVNADVDNVMRGMGSDHRIGFSFLKAGVGYGGSCFPKDLKALASLGMKNGVQLPLIEATQYVNDTQPRALLSLLDEYLGGVSGRRIALLGLSFKPMTDDLREAPSLKFCEWLLEAGAHVRAYDPLVRQIPYETIPLCTSVLHALDGCDAALIPTEWEEFRHIDWGQALKLMRSPVIVDGRNLYSLSEMNQLAEIHELVYLSVGRPAVRSRIPIPIPAVS